MAPRRPTPVRPSTGLLRPARQIQRVNRAGGWVEVLLNPPSAVQDTIRAEYLAAQRAGETGEPY
jgi:hypothetical protein